MSEQTDTNKKSALAFYEMAYLGLPRRAVRNM